MFIEMTYLFRMTYNRMHVTIEIGAISEIHLEETKKNSDSLLLHPICNDVFNDNN